MFQITEHSHFFELRFFIPESANALSLKAARSLVAYKPKQKPVVVRSGHPRLFCSGGNLSDYAGMKSKAQGLKVNAEIARCLDQFAAWSVPKLAVIEGDVLGGGMEWLARFDVRWSLAANVFVFWQRRIGLTTGWKGGTAWAQKIGADRVRQLLLEARPLAASEALQLGLIDRILPAWRLESEILRWAQNHAPELNSSLVRWTPANETKTFAKLWLGPTHKATLKRWAKGKNKSR